MNNYHSSLRLVKCGVPQGSLLGPLLLLVFINDLFNCCLNTTLSVYANDTYLIISNDNLNVFEEKVNFELKIVYNWTVQNKIAMNPSKSQCFVIFPKLKENCLQLRPMLNNVSIPVVKSENIWVYLLTTN